MAQATKSAKEFGDKGFLRRLTLATAWGEGLDGFDLGVLSVVLVPVSVELGISPVWAGLIGASSLIGIFFGAPIAALTPLCGAAKPEQGCRTAGLASENTVVRRQVARVHYTPANRT